MNFREWLNEDQYYSTEIDWENDNVDSIIQKIASISCGEHPDPGSESTAIFGLEDLRDLMCVIKGEKKVAWMKAPKMIATAGGHTSRKAQEILNRLLQAAKAQGLAVIQQDLRGGAPGLVVGPKHVVGDVKSLANLTTVGGLQHKKECHHQLANPQKCLILYTEP